MLEFHLRYSMSYKFYEVAVISNVVKAILTFCSFHPGPRRPHARAHLRPHPLRRRRRRRRPLPPGRPRSSPRPHPRCRRRRRRRPLTL